jgi:hypothetical protein
MKNMRKILAAVIVLLVFATQMHIAAQTSSPMRRELSPQQPMWIIHIDTWNYPDPQKIINLIPEDIRPYVVFNISLSISHNTTTGQFQVAEYGYEIAKSWIRTCAENQVWAMVQVASGGITQVKFPDNDLTVYEEFFREYPNFIGFNYCEQFWGFDDTDQYSVKWVDRINHFVDLLELSDKYGGYLVVSWCSNQWGQSINPIGMLKRNPAFAEACRKYTKNYILCEKYTQEGYNYDTESLCLGAYLSGYSGNYGIRYDNSGWTDATGVNQNFTLATAGAIHLEHIMLTGQTVIDGPEIIWINCFKGLNDSSTPDGYTKRNWTTFAHFDNVMIDNFRKILDGTVRIPTRKEVIDRTKYVVVNDVSTGDDNAKYCSATTQFDGLYSMDANYENNKTFFKKSGRYPTIPTVFQLNDADANSFQFKVNKSSYLTRWSSVNAKVAEMNNQFLQEYTGDLYAGRHENAWVIYNPYKTDQTASGSIHFKYNTCDHMELTYSRYTASVVKEYGSKVTFYLSNFDDEVVTGLKTDIIKIYGSSSEPSWSYEERGKHQASTISKDWSEGVFTLTIQHNGPLDITVNCSGSATERLTSYTTATLTAPEKPALYAGPRQYEAECFDRKSISGIVTAGQNFNVRNYTGQGYIKFGLLATASVRDSVTVLKRGVYKLQTRYSVVGGNVGTIDLYVNGAKVATPVFTSTPTQSDWGINTQNITLNAGSNAIIFKASTAAPYSVFIDNIVISPIDEGTFYDFANDDATTSASTPAAQYVTVQSGSAGVVSYTDGNSLTSNCFKPYTVGSVNGTGVAELDMFLPSATDYSVTWKEYYGTSGGKKGMLLRASGEYGSCPYAVGMKQGYLFLTLNNNDNTVTLLPYVASEAGLTAKTSYTSVFQVNPNQPCWFRASATGNTLRFECSQDSITWEGGSVATFNDNAYTMGSTELVWGVNTNNLNWWIDNIVSTTKTISPSKANISGLNYIQGAGPSAVQSFTVSGNGLLGNLNITSTADFEISLSELSGYGTSLSLTQNGGKVALQTIYVRLKSDLSSNVYSGKVMMNSDLMPEQTINLKGTVSISPQVVSKVYNFTSDVAGVSATTPPAINTSIGTNNGATAGVVSYTDGQSNTSNMLKPFSGGVRNATGIINLNSFSQTSSDYSVTWKQCIGTPTTDYKVGVLLRGDVANVGGATTGYVQGMMPGYLFLVYNSNGRTELRIYRSTSATNLNMIASTNLTTLVPTSGQPVWYRASVSGYLSASLKLEYSTDNITWKTGPSYNDTPANFVAGATQIVWGLGTGATDFYLDDITFNGTEEPIAYSNVTLSQSSLSGFSYIQNSGPSDSKPLSISGTLLADNVTVCAPANYEVSLNSTSNFASSLSLTPSGGSLAPTTLYVRLASGLEAGTGYVGNMRILSSEISQKIVSLSGSVSAPAFVQSISTSVGYLSGFTYVSGTGPSSGGNFTVSGIGISDNVTITAPANYEVSLSDGTGYSSSVVLAQSGGVVASTTIYVRMKSGLPAGNFNGNIMLSSTGASSKFVALTGAVTATTSHVIDKEVNDATVLRAEYYMLNGQKVSNIENQTGVIIVKKYMSDGSVSTSKILIRKR